MINRNFETEEQARKYVEVEIEALGKCEIIGSRFCPLINGACVTTCVCFGMPHVSGNDSIGWNCWGSYCSNAMFSSE